MNNENQSSTAPQVKKQKSWKISTYVLAVVAAVLAVGLVYTNMLMQQAQDDNKALNKQIDDLRSGLDTAADKTQIDTTTDVEATTDYKSQQGVAVVVTSPVAGSTILTSPLTVSGQVPGSWSHEGKFSVELRDSKSAVVATGTATLSGDWQTDKLVDFTATLTWTGTLTGDHTLVLEKANPSGLAANADSVEIAFKLD